MAQILRSWPSIIRELDGGIIVRSSGVQIDMNWMRWRGIGVAVQQIEQRAVRSHFETTGSPAEQGE
jgi:hypothetical protein